MKGRLAALVAVSLLAGCRAETLPKTRAAPPAPAPSASTPSPSAASARRAPEPAPEPQAARFGDVRAPTDPQDLERLAFLKSVCEVGVQGATAELPQQLGCTCCPPFLECPPRADGSLVENPDHVYGMEGVARGRFTRKDVDQELVTVHGCGVSMNGGSIAVLDSSRGKRTTAAHEDFMVVPARCEPYRLPDGHDLAVCEALSANQSFARLRVVVGDLSKPEEQRWQELVELVDGGISACFGQPGEPFVRNTLVRRGFADENRDGRLDLALEVDRLRAVSSQPFIDRCVAWLEAGPTPPPTTPAPWGLLARPRRERLVFLHDGARFVASPATKRAHQGLSIATSPAVGPLKSRRPAGTTRYPSVRFSHATSSAQR